MPPYRNTRGFQRKQLTLHSSPTAMPERVGGSIDECRSRSDMPAFCNSGDVRDPGCMGN
jgi:hypothetical protein